MYEQQAVGVVVPAYNEERHVGTVIKTMPEFVDRVYAVDDRSTDRTWGVIREYADRTVTPAGDNALTTEPVSEVESAADEPVTDGGSRESVGGAAEPTDADRSEKSDKDGHDDDGHVRAATDGSGRVVGIRHATNRGAGGAIVTGYRQALADSVDVIAVMDGDGQMDPAVLDRIVAPVAAGEAGYAKGDRLSDPRLREEMSGWRTFGNVMLTLLTRVSTGYWRVTDAQNGYTAIAADIARELPLDALYERYGFLNDLLARLNERGVRVVDVPHEAVYGSEDSGIRYPSFVPRLSTLLARNFVRRVVRRHVVREFHPLAGCYAVGTLGLGSVVPVAALVGVGMVTPAAALLALFGSVFLLVQAVVFDYRTNGALCGTHEPTGEPADTPVARN